MKWNEDLSIAIGKMNDRDRRNEMERPRYPGTEECHLFANNSLQIKERIAQRGRLRNRGLGPVWIESLVFFTLLVICNTTTPHFSLQ